MSGELEIKSGENGTCYHCGREPSAEPHECPFASEIHGCGDQCNCCEDCQYQCAMDI